VFAKFGDENDLAKKILAMLKQKKIDRQKIRTRMVKYSSENLVKGAYSVYKSVLK